jgi:two-component system response regulator
MRKRKVLLLEDSPDDELFTLRAFRRLSGIDVHVARDGQAALDWLEEFQPDLIVLDIQVPKVSGLEVLRYIRSNERLRVVPVVVLTSSNEECDVEGSYALGANSFVQKPVEYEAYQDAVRLIGEYWLGVDGSGSPVR